MTGTTITSGFSYECPATIRELAGRIATELHLPDDRLNDGVKDFLSARHGTCG
jgi:hypothetical protein